MQSVKDGARLTTKMLHTIWIPKNTAHSSMEQMTTLPLHAKHVLKRDLDQRRAQMESMQRYIGNDDTHLRRFTRCVAELDEYEPHASDDYSDAELADDDVPILLTEQIIQRAPPHLQATRSTIRVFTTPEKGPTRRRIVNHPPNFNKTVSERRAADDDDDDPDERQQQNIELPSGEPLHRKVQKWRFAKCVDFAFAFAQFALPRRLKRKFSFTYKGITYWLAIIPTGGANSSQISQEFLSQVCSVILKIFNAKVTLIDTDVYIDNVRVMANDVKTLDDALDALFQLCHHVTLRQLLQIYGTLNYATSVNRTCRGRFYYTHKFFRRRAAAEALLDEPARPWACIRAQLMKWIEDGIDKNCSDGEKPLKRFWSDTPHDRRSAILYTDASDVGMGAILFRDDGSIAVFARSWSRREKKHHINVKEAIAVREALTHLDLRNIHDLQLRIDNTSTVYCSQKGSSKSFILNSVVEQIWDNGNFGKITSIEYIRSEDNRADALSRLLLEHRLCAKSNNPLLARALEYGRTDHPQIIVTHSGRDETQ